MLEWRQHSWVEEQTPAKRASKENARIVHRSWLTHIQVQVADNHGAIHDCLGHDRVLEKPIDVGTRILKWRRHINMSPVNRSYTMRVPRPPLKRLFDSHPLLRRRPRNQTG